VDTLRAAGAERTLTYIPLTYILRPISYIMLTRKSGTFLAFERRYQETASPFQWTFTRKNLTTLLAKIENKRLASAA
jgi:hypothetical protein